VVQHRHGPLRDGVDAHRDDIGTADVRSEFGKRGSSHIRLRMPLTITERREKLEILLWHSCVSWIGGISDLTQQPVLVIGDSTACTLLPGLEAVGPSYGMQFENGAVIACGIVSGQLPPVVIHNQEFYSNTFTKACQGQANRAEELGIDRYKPKIIVWASTEERDSIVP
jgi:hypothetical protein